MSKISLFSLQILCSKTEIKIPFLLSRYLPSSMTFTPIQDDEEDEKKKHKEKKKKKKNSSWIANLLFSQLSYIVIAIIVICIIERKKLSRDPLNFSTLNIIFEVTR